MALASTALSCSSLLTHIIVINLCVVFFSNNLIVVGW